MSLDVSCVILLEAGSPGQAECSLRLCAVSAAGLAGGRRRLCGAGAAGARDAADSRRRHVSRDSDLNLALTLIMRGSPPFFHLGSCPHTLLLSVSFCSDRAVRPFAKDRAMCEQVLARGDSIRMRHRLAPAALQRGPWRPGVAAALLRGLAACRSSAARSGAVQATHRRGAHAIHATALQCVLLYCEHGVQSGWQPFSVSVGSSGKQHRFQWLPLARR